MKKSKQHNLLKKAWLTCQKAFKVYVTIPAVIITAGIVSALIYTFSFLFPFTDNAFVVNNVQPVAAQVQGYITDLYVSNGESVKKGQKLMTVFKKPYQYAVEQLMADKKAARATLKALQKSYERTQFLSTTREKMYTKLALDDKKYQAGFKAQTVSLIRLQNSEQQTKAAFNEWKAAEKQIEVIGHNIQAQRNRIKSIGARLNYARVNLELTDVYAKANGVIENLFLNIGTPVNINQPLFSLVDTDDIYIQANFNETDLMKVRQGAKVYIFPRMYVGVKMFHGVVNSDFWSANRQRVDSRTQLQNVTNENQWVLLPQRMPVIIKVTDPDPNYPLRAGSSAYVYIRV